MRVHFVIGDMTEFLNLQELRGAYLAKEDGEDSMNFDVIEYHVEYTMDPDHILMIGRGLAFSMSWTSEGSFSFVSYPDQD